MRFVAETAYGADVGDAVFRRTNGIGWLIMDQAIFDEATAAGAFFGDPVATADTIDALAEQLEVPVSVLANTVSFYNEHAALGEDPVFHKHEEFLQSIETGPFVAFDYGINKGIPYIILGGLRSSMNTEVINSFGEVIPGLYGAGRVSPGLSQEYYVSGSAVADCTFWGRIAGKSAAAADSWS